MTRFDEDVLELAMARTTAQEQLANPDYSGNLSMAGFEDLLVRAGYGREAAHKAALERGWDRMTSGLAV